MKSISLVLLALASTASAFLYPTDTGTQDTGSWSDWGPWSPCSSSCMVSRVRKCNAKTSGSSIDLTTLMLLESMGSSGSSSSISSLLPLIASGGSLDVSSLMLMNALGSSSSSNSLLPLIISGALGGGSTGMGDTDSLTTLLLLTSMTDNSTSSSSNDLLTLMLVGGGGLGGSSGNGGGLSSQDPLITMLLLNSMNSNDSSGMSEILPLINLLSSSGTDQSSDMSLMLMLMNMGNNNSSSMDPLLLLQLFGQGSSTGSSSAAQCAGSRIETAKCPNPSCGGDTCLTNWGPFEECSATCGGGFRRRIRSCTCTNPLTGMPQCTQPMEEKRPCGHTPCGSPDAQWLEWGPYSSCQPYGMKCYKTKTRSCSIDIGCVGAFEQAVECTCDGVPQIQPAGGPCAVSGSNRVDCGVPGITRSMCEQSGCCFDSSSLDSYWCYHPNSG